MADDSASKALAKQLGKQKWAAKRKVVKSADQMLDEIKDEPMTSKAPTGRFCRGLLRLLYQAMFPQGWSMDRLRLLPRVDAMTADDALARTEQKASKPRYVKNPMKRGQDLHKRFDTWFKSKKKVPSKGFVRVIHDALFERGLTPVATELKVARQQLALFTYVDIVCKDGKGEVWIVELKTTQTTIATMETAQCELLLPFAQFPGSTMTLHYMQAACTQALYEGSNPAEKIGGCAVIVWISNNTVYWRDVPSALLAKRERMLEATAAQR